MGGLIVGNGGAALSAAPAIAPSAYQALKLQTSLADVLSAFGVPTSKPALNQLLGTGGLAPLVQAQPANQACAYYLDKSARQANAFQLCFDAARRLITKSIISTSGGATAASSGAS